MSVQDLREALRDLPGSETITVQYGAHGNQIIQLGTRSIEVGPMASVDEVRAKLTNPFDATDAKANTAESNRMATLGEQLKAARAKLAEARDGAARAVADCADASAIVLQEADKASKEAAALKAEVAELTNGGPQ